MIEFIKANLVDIIFILVLIAGLVGLYFAGKKSAVKKIIYDIIKQADIKMDAEPDEKFQTVYDLLPKTIRFLYSLKDIRQIVDDIFRELEDALNQSDNNKGAQG